MQAGSVKQEHDLAKQPKEMDGDDVSFIRTVSTIVYTFNGEHCSMITTLPCAVGGHHLSSMHERRIHEAWLPRCGRVWVTALPLRTGAKKSGQWSLLKYEFSLQIVRRVRNWHLIWCRSHASSGSAPFNLRTRSRYMPCTHRVLSLERRYVWT